MASSAVGVCVSVVQGANVLVKERLLRVPDSCTLADLFNRVTDDAVLVAEASVVCCKQLNSAWINASVTDDVGLLVNDFGCRYIRFQLPPKDVEPPPPKRAARAANEVLMGTSRLRNRLPKRRPEKNKKEQLFNDVRSLLLSRDVGFSPAAADSEGFTVVNCLVNALWAIDACHDTLKNATSKKGQVTVPQLPEVWQKFQGYNDYKSKKVAKPRLKSPVLKEFAQELFRIAGLPSLQVSDWCQTKSEIEGFANTLDGYANYLEDANQAQLLRQSAAHPARQVCVFIL